MKKYRITIDTYRCNGCGSCESLCPDLFTVNRETEKVELIKEETDNRDDLHKAVSACPRKCIDLY